jgi:gas vesicle protein
MDKDGLTNFLLGIGVGVGLGLLFAPKAGEETRGLIKDKANEGTDYLKKASAEWKSTAEDLVSKGKDALNQQKSNLNDAVEAGKQAYREKVEPKIAETLA